MATVKIFIDEVRDDLLPLVCAKCGAPTENKVSKKFTCSWRLTVRVPLCDVHRHHWTIREFVAACGIIPAFGYPISALVADANNCRGANDGPAGLLCVSVLGFGLLWLLLMAALTVTSIRPAEVTHSHIVLVGVSEGFKQALLDRDEEGEERSDERRRYDPRGSGLRRDDYRARDN